MDLQVRLKFVSNRKKKVKKIKFTIPLIPISKKNSQRILRAGNKPFIAPSAQYKDYEAKAVWYVPKGKQINTPVNVKCLFYMPTRRRVDGLNLAEAIDDILVKAGLLEDDNRDIVAGHDGTRVFYDKENPRTEVEITYMTDYAQWKVR